MTNAPLIRLLIITLFLLLMLAPASALLTDSTPVDARRAPATRTDLPRHPRVAALAADLSAETDNDARVALVDAFFRDVSTAGLGMPLIDNGTDPGAPTVITFLYLQELGIDAPIRVAGDFNGWSTTGGAYEFERVLDDFWLWEVRIDGAAVERMTQQRYKFVASEGDTEVWFADEHAIRYGFDDFGEYSMIWAGAGAALERIPAFYSPQLDNSRTIRIFLPPGYDLDTGTRYPVLYMHDGQNLFDPSGAYGSWLVQEVATGLIGEGKTVPFIVVGVDHMGSERLDEYSHVEDDLRSEGIHGGKAPAYGAFLTETLKPYIDARYRTVPHRLATATMGSSMGGLVSVYLGWDHNATFSMIGALSSTLEWGKFTYNETTMIEHVAAGVDPDLVIYLDSGGGPPEEGCEDTDGDGIWDDDGSANNWGGDNYCVTMQLYEVLQQRGYSPTELTADPTPVEDATALTEVYHYWAAGAPHSESAWHQRVDIPLMLFFNPARWSVITATIAQEQHTTDPGDTNGTDPGDTNGTDPGDTNGTDPGDTNGTDPGDTNGTDPGDMNGTDPGDTNGTDPGDTNGTDPGDMNGTDPGTNGTGDNSDPGSNGTDPDGDDNGSNGTDPNDDTSGIAPDDPDDPDDPGDSDATDNSGGGGDDSDSSAASSVSDGGLLADPPLVLVAMAAVAVAILIMVILIVRLRAQ